MIGEQGLFAGELTSVGAFGVEVFDDLIFEMGRAEGQWISFVAVTDVKDLANGFGAIAAMLGEVLRHGDSFWQDLSQ